MLRPSVLLALCLCTCAIGLRAQAQKPAIAKLIPATAKIAIGDADEAPQLQIDGERTNGKRIDLTGEAKYAVADAKIVRVDDTGRVFPLANGSTTITAKHGELAASIPVEVKGMETPRPINFANQIEPILTKLSCNSGGCHGKIAGQNNFRLSLLGFDPELDYATLVKESRGRRIFAADPDQSLLLLKGAGVLPHGGGKKMDVGSEEYKVLRRWVATGTPFGSDKDPKIAKVTVQPVRRAIERQAKQQLAVYAHYSDGRVEDVTRRAQYESNETEVATVGESGLVSTLGATGQAAIMVRFSGQVATFGAIVPRSEEPVKFDFDESNVIDKFTAAKWRELGLTPSEASSDEAFVRRVHLDIAGTLPTVEAVKAFLADKATDKRAKLIDKLIDSPEYSDFFANKWADVLRVKRRGEQERAQGTFAFHGWIRDAIAADKPYDEFVREIVCAIGDEVVSPPTVWYKEVQTPEQFVDDLSQVFLGQRLRPVPPPPVREVEPGRLLGPRRLLRPRRQEGDSDGGSPQQRAESKGFDLHEVDRQHREQAERQSRRDEGPRWPGTDCHGRRRSPGHARRLDDRPEEPVPR